MCSGDEMSKRAKFALVTWFGNEVSALKRAKIPIDKAVVKDVISVCCYLYFDIFYA
jgi:hypothetical protein